VSNLVLTPILLILIYKLFGLSGGWNPAFGLLYILSIAFTGVTTFDTNSFSDEKYPSFLDKTRNALLISILVLFTAIQFKNGANFYNQATAKETNTIQKYTSREGFYDNMWKTYRTQNNNTKMSEETFMKVTSILLENRKDGPNVTWKWLQETRQVPYEEFTKFYTSLNSYIVEERRGYYNLEVECQKATADYNIYLKTFPNNIYNLFVGKKPIVYRYGFTSDSTQSVFKSGIEN